MSNSGKQFLFVWCLFGGVCKRVTNSLIASVAQVTKARDLHV